MENTPSFVYQYLLIYVRLRFYCCICNDSVLQIHFAKVKSQTDVNKFEMQNTQFLSSYGIIIHFDVQQVIE